MVKVDTVYEDEFKRILRCSEGNRIWITDLDYRFGYGFD